jgi:hypothetical protein
MNTNVNIKEHWWAHSNNNLDKHVVITTDEHDAEIELMNMF